MEKRMRRICITKQDKLANPCLKSASRRIDWDAACRLYASAMRQSKQAVPSGKGSMKGHRHEMRCEHDACLSLCAGEQRRRQCAG
jgi:hypothetical protein